MYGTPRDYNETNILPSSRDTTWVSLRGDAMVFEFIGGPVGGASPAPSGGVSSRGDALVGLRLSMLSSSEPAVWRRGVVDGFQGASEERAKPMHHVLFVGGGAYIMAHTLGF